VNCGGLVNFYKGHELSSKLVIFLQARHELTSNGWNTTGNMEVRQFKPTNLKIKLANIL
jgi:hypothetical protein